ERQHAAGAVDKPPEDLTRIGVDGAVATFIQQPLCSRRALRRWEIEKRQEIARLVMGTGFFELCPPLGIDQGGCHIWKSVGRIRSCGMALRLDKDRPTGSKATQGIVQTPGDGHELGGYRAIEIGAAEPCRPLKRAVLVEDNALIDEGSPRQKVRETRIRPAIFGK